MGAFNMHQIKRRAHKDAWDAWSDPMNPFARGLPRAPTFETNNSVSITTREDLSANAELCASTYNEEILRRLSTEPVQNLPVRNIAIQDCGRNPSLSVQTDYGHRSRPSSSFLSIPRSDDPRIKLTNGTPQLNDEIAVNLTTAEGGLRKKLMSSRASTKSKKRGNFTIKNQIQRTLFNSWINVLLLAAPVGIALHLTSVSPVAVFVVNFIAIIPLAALLSYATEEIALRVSECFGGLLNSTLGNAIELVASTISLLQVEIGICKTSSLALSMSQLFTIIVATTTAFLSAVFLFTSNTRTIAVIVLFTCAFERQAEENNGHEPALHILIGMTLLAGSTIIIALCAEFIVDFISVLAGDDLDSHHDVDRNTSLRFSIEGLQSKCVRLEVKPSTNGRYHRALTQRRSPNVTFANFLSGSFLAFISFPRLAAAQGAVPLSSETATVVATSTSNQYGDWPMALVIPLIAVLCLLVGEWRSRQRPHSRLQAYGFSMIASAAAYAVAINNDNFGVITTVLLVTFNISFTIVFARKLPAYLQLGEYDTLFHFAIILFAICCDVLFLLSQNLGAQNGQQTSSQLLGAAPQPQTTFWQALIPSSTISIMLCGVAVKAQQFLAQMRADLRKFRERDLERAREIGSAGSCTGAEATSE